MPGRPWSVTPCDEVRESLAAVTVGDLPALREDARTATARFNPSTTGATPDPATVACLVNPLGIGLEATPIASPHT